MKSFYAAVSILVMTAMAGAQVPTSTSPISYPQVKTIDHVDDYHGTKVPDPYRWLEDPNSAETKAWVEAQNKVTFGFLETIPERAAIRERLTKLWDYERYGVPTAKGARYFYTRNDGLQNQSVVYWQDLLAGQSRVLLDPNQLSKDGTVALMDLVPADDGKLAAYGLASAGSDWMEWKVRNVETGQDLADHVRWVKFSTVSWVHGSNGQGQGFFYSRYDEPKEGTAYSGELYFHKLYDHKLGTPQSEDPLIYQRSDRKDWNFGGEVTNDGRYLIIDVREGTDERGRVYYKDLGTPDSPVVELLNAFDADYRFIDNDGPVFWFQTDNSAPRYRVIAVDTRNPQPANWKTLIPESEATLEAVNVIDNKFVARYLKDAYSQVRVFDLAGKPLREVQLPGVGTASGFGGTRKDKETFYAYTSYTTPTTIYRYDLQSGQSTVFRKPQVDFKSEDYETRQVFYNSKDGTRVPMFLTYRKGLKLDGQNPTLLYGYGGFNIPMTPGFSPSNVVWLEMGGVFAVANLRGGGEYGKEWHEAGMKLRKQNVFDDFIFAAEWLIANKYTSTPRLAIEGRSNGGLLVGAAITQRPDLFGAALPAVGVMDMLRFNKFTIGWAWASDYGSPENADEFKALRAYSPYHNVKKGVQYPPTMVTTADHDDRVVPAHSFKFASALQAAQSGPNPVLIRVETSAGHGAGKPTSKLIEEAADRWAFLVKELKVKTNFGSQQRASATE
ncbi:MAG: prolyl oligopeptidase family protein [Candidatus Korobacteraceae bacterium]